MSAAAAIIIASQKKKQNDEEEQMVNYKSNELDSLEFKILRSNTGAFGNPETMKQVITEESQNGWLFTEKFDNSRLRFHRNISHRKNDDKAILDPYRTTYGISEWELAIIIILGICVFLGILVMLVAMGSVRT